MSDLSWPVVLTALVAGRDLDVEATSWAMEEILSGAATPAQIAGFAVALRAKGETVAEVEGLVETMYHHAAPMDVEGRVVDIVGTGGDMARTVNISTMASVVMAGAGVPVVKHGNRAASSASGSADVLEQLGVRLDLTPAAVAEVVRRAGITFCFAPVFHASLRYAGAPRRELGIATTFNFLGPLTNPARPAACAVGVADRTMAPVMAGVFARRGVDALVFRGDDGLDEITVTTTTSVWVVRGGEVETATLDPRDLGVELSAIDALAGGDAAFNAAVFGRLVDGETGPVRDAVLMNAAAGLAAHAADPGDLTTRMRAGMDRARISIDSGSARRVLDRWATVTADLATP
ncbi:MAG: anthranilate phosphoribosyltransferase [Nocardioidaceae bacterium]|nr:anthranilate phosphoribosyltransferase [Nocardioidaceae bacterium]